MMFSPGQRVKLLAFEDEPEETGVIVSVDPQSEMYVVYLDAVNLEQDDDGIREVGDTQMRSL